MYCAACLGLAPPSAASPSSKPFMANSHSERTVRRACAACLSACRRRSVFISVSLMEALQAVLAAGDTDALRMQLKQQLSVEAAAAASSSAQGEQEADEDDDDAQQLPNPAAHLIDRAGAVADELLKQGLPHLERAHAAATAAAAAAAAAEQRPHIDIPTLGLMMRATPVMSQAVWPAALALGRWLRARGDALCDGASVVELGAGGGAPGLVARRAGASFLLATDGDESLVPLLAANIEANAGRGSWRAMALDWCDADAVAAAAADATSDGSYDGGGFDLVLAADVVYTPGDIQPLVRAARKLVRH